MDQLAAGDRVSARIASPFINGIKRVLTRIGVFTNAKGYKDEIARYESELRRNKVYENESRPGIEADEREAATS